MRRTVRTTEGPPTLQRSDRLPERERGLRPRPPGSHVYDCRSPPQSASRFEFLVAFVYRTGYISGAISQIA